MRGLALGVVLACATIGTSVQAKVYTGSEAAALRCAAILSVVPSAAARAGMIAPNQVRMFHAASTVVLLRYVSGSVTQKQKAMATVASRYSPQQHVHDFRTKSQTCLRQFPLS